MPIPTTDTVDRSRLEELRHVAGPGPVLILTHDNPDPDALAAGKALATLFNAAWSVPSRLIYSGVVLRAENRALLNYLTPEWEQSDLLPDLQAHSAVALVDTQPGAGNNRFPADLVPQIVLDHHHPLRGTLRNVPFADVRPEIGATVTLLDQYMAAAGVSPDSDLATAMFYGLKTDTRALSRGTSPADIATYLALLAQIDHSKLIQVEQAGLPQEYFQAFNRGLHAAQVYDRTVVANLGAMHRPDLAAEMADILIRLESARAVLCLGVHDQTMHLSVRTEPMGEDAGLLVQQVIVAPGKAGGHGTMAGGQVPIAGKEKERLAGEITRRFLDVMQETGAGERLV